MRQAKGGKDVGRKNTAGAECELETLGGGGRHRTLKVLTPGLSQAMYVA